jgi:hypothetical protein
MASSSKMTPKYPALPSPPHYSQNSLVFLLYSSRKMVSDERVELQPVTVQRRAHEHGFLLNLILWPTVCYILYFINTVAD